MKWTSDFMVLICPYRVPRLMEWRARALLEPSHRVKRHENTGSDRKRIWSTDCVHSVLLQQIGFAKYRTVHKIQVLLLWKGPISEDRVSTMRPFLSWRDYYLLQRQPLRRWKGGVWRVTVEVKSTQRKTPKSFSTTEDKGEMKQITNKRRQNHSAVVGKILVSY